RPLTAGERVERTTHLFVVEEELHQPRHRLAFGDRRGVTHELKRRRLRVLRSPVLCEQSEPDRGACLPFAGVRLELAGEQLEQHRLAGAVLADDADALAAEHREVDTGEDRDTAELDAYVGELDDALAAAPVWPQLERDPAALQCRPVDLLHAVDLP